jgi:transcriptional regulator with XRE-family HTH domain
VQRDPKPATQRELFGSYLRSLRERAALKQLEAGERLQKIGGGTSASWQSILARAELGKGVVRPEQLPWFAEVYGEPLERVASAFAATHIFSSPFPSYLTAPSLKDAPPTGQRSFFVSNVVEMWSLPEIALWEAGLVRRSPGRDDLAIWIISPDFVDHKDSEFLRIVVDDLLLNGVCLTYFVAQRDLGDGEKFEIFLDRVTIRIRDVLRAQRRTLADVRLGEIAVYGLTNDDLAWFTSSLVIANPDDVEAGADGLNGFMIVPVHGEHALGIPIGGPQLSVLVNRIKRQIERRRRTPGAAIWTPNALRSHPLFKEEVAND